jgi:maleate isomerase
LEPLTASILSSQPHVTEHFSRFPVTTIGLSSSALSPFEPHKLVEAAQLLAHAKVDVIGWSGTSPSLLGFAADEELCAVIT